MGSSRAELESLLGLINSATQDAIAVYEKSGHGIPSVHSPKKHPLDNQATVLALKKAVRVLEGACEQLCTTLAPPSHTLVNFSMVHFGSACMRIAIQERVAEKLADSPNGLSITELSEKTSIESWKLRRVLRALATRHCFQEVRPDVYANNRLSITLIETPAADLLNLMTGIVHDASRAFPDAIRDPLFGPSLEAEKSPLMFHLRDKGISGNLFSYLKATPDVAKTFSSGMVGWAKLTDNAALLQDVPWAKMPSGTTVCDVGGGIGSVSIQLAKAYPHLKITLQDLPGVIEQARVFWAAECPQAVKEDRIDFIPLDFFKNGPARNQDIYYIRHVIHDWPDADSVTILKNIRQVMGKTSRLFIHEYILPVLQNEKSPASNDMTSAPEPLLYNYGAGSVRPYYQDLNMLCMMNAGQRTIDEFKALGMKAGLDFVKVWDFAENGMVEFKLA